MNLTIAWHDIEDDVLRYSEYAGQKYGAYDKVRALHEDSEQLCQFFDAAVDSLVATLGSIVKIENRANDEARLELRVRNRLESSIKDAAKQVLVNYVVSHWFRLVLPEAEQVLTAERVGMENTLIKLAYKREMPL